MQARPQKARDFGLKALNRALQGVKGTTAVHICFGYAAIIHERPAGYSFLPEFHNCPVHQVSIETAQSKLDTAVLKTLPGKTIILGVIDLEDKAVEKPETVAARIRRALPHVPAEQIIVAPDCGMKYLPHDVAYAKLEAMVAGAAIVRDELMKKRRGAKTAKKAKPAARKSAAKKKAPAKRKMAKKSTARRKTATRRSARGRRR
jgi:5-methyltetrahydropteroyltriglutamate--homocysteine methyltransferase